MLKPLKPAPSAPQSVARSSPAPAPKPAPSAARKAFTPDELSSGRGSALRARAASQLGASSLARPAATTLLTENADDGQVNCLDAANDYLEALPPERRAAAQVIFLHDTRPGAEGVDGHVLVRDGGRFVDPTTGQAFGSLTAFDPERHYAPAGTLPGQQLVEVLNTPPGSGARRAALAGVPASLQRMLVADTGGQWAPPRTPANPEGQPFLKVISRNGLNFRSGPSADSRQLAALGNGTELRLLPPPEGVQVPEGWAYVQYGEQTGYVWAGADAVQGSDGLRSGMPYENGTELGVTRTGSGASAVEWGRAWMDPEVGDLVLNDKGERVEFGYANNCLKFVMKAYGSFWGENPTRSTHLSNPRATSQQLGDARDALVDAGLYANTSRATTPLLHESGDPKVVSTGTAFGAWRSLEGVGATIHANSVEELLALDPRPPEGAMIFFAPTEANIGAGHIALLTWHGDEPYVLSSGSPGDPSVREVPLQEMIDWTGPLLGVADMNDRAVINPDTLPVARPPEPERTTGPR